MAKLEHYYTKFEEGHIYHIYNRTIDKQPYLGMTIITGFL
jgi:hypothetical protein